MPSDGEPSKPMLAVVHEFAIRWPCPKDTDPDFYSARLKMLARDCGEMSPGLLRKAGDYVARIPGRFNTMPSASELYQAAEQVIADRAAKQVAEQRQHAAEQGRPMPQPGDKSAAYAAANLRALKAGMRGMQTASGELFRLGEPGERRGVRRDGSAIEPFFRRPGEVDGVASGWYCRAEDSEVLAACYRHYEARFTVRGAMICDVAA